MREKARRKKETGSGIFFFSFTLSHLLMNQSLLWSWLWSSAISVSQQSLHCSADSLSDLCINFKDSDPHLKFRSFSSFFWITKALLRAAFPPKIVCVYLEPFESYKASKLTMLKKYVNMQRIFPYNVRPWRATTPRHTFLESSRQADA